MLVDHLPCARVEHDLGEEPRVGAPGVGGGLSERRHVDRDEAVQVAGGAVALEGAEPCQPVGVDRRHPVLDDGGEEPFAVPEVVLRGALVALAGRSLNLAKRGSGEALLGHEPLGGEDHRVASIGSGHAATIRRSP